MGLIGFVKDAGEELLAKLVGREDDDSKAVRERVEDMGLGVDDLGVTVEGARVVLRGTATRRADAEKAVLAAGNIPGISEVDDRIDVAERTRPSTYYEVGRGDTLFRVAAHFYGDATKYLQIFEANQPMLRDPDEIYPGQVLRIPPIA